MTTKSSEGKGIKIPLLCKLGFHQNKITKIDETEKYVPGKQHEYVTYKKRTVATFFKCSKCGEKTKDMETELITIRYR